MPYSSTVSCSELVGSGRMGPKFHLQSKRLAQVVKALTTSMTKERAAEAAQNLWESMPRDLTDACLENLRSGQSQGTMTQRELDQMLEAQPYLVLASLLEITGQAVDRLEQQARGLLEQKKALSEFKASRPPQASPSRGGLKP